MSGIVVLGVGMHEFGRFPDKTFKDLALNAVDKAIKDAGIGFGDIQAAIYSHVNPQGLSPGEVVLEDRGLSGIPMMNVENACASGQTAIWEAYRLITLGVYDIVLVFGTEKMPKGAINLTIGIDWRSAPQVLLGTDFMMSAYALRARHYMMEYGAPIEAIAQVSVKNHRNGAMNPYAQFRQPFTLEEVLNSRMICDPLTLYQCCPTTDGGAAAVLCSEKVAKKYTTKPVKVIGSAITTQKYSRTPVYEHGHTERAGVEARRMAGVDVKDIDLAEIHDAATIGEIMQSEALGLCPKGEGWRWLQEGKTEINGEVAINASGGLQSLGHPMGATGIRQAIEVTWHLRGQAGDRQVPGAKVGITQASGAGGVCGVTVIAS